MINILNGTMGNPLSLYLTFNDHNILVDIKEESCLQKLKEEFHFFISPEVVEPDSVLTVQATKGPELPSLVASKVLNSGTIYHLGDKQFIDYHGKALVILNREERSYEVYAQDPERLYELCFLTLHSLLGEELDIQGLCRIHALGISKGNINSLVMLPSGGGKSTLLLELLQDQQVMIISDDTPLVSRNGTIYPFPSKISLDNPPTEGPLKELHWRRFQRLQHPLKWTASLAQLQNRLAQNPENNRTLLLHGLRLSTGKSIIVPVSRWKMISPLLEHMVLGIGLPQIMEIFLQFKWTDIFKMIGHALYRVRSAYHLLMKSKCYYFYIGPDKKMNAKLLLDLMNDEQQTSD